MSNNSKIKDRLNSLARRVAFLNKRLAGADLTKWQRDTLGLERRALTWALESLVLQTEDPRLIAAVEQFAQERKQRKAAGATHRGPGAATEVNSLNSV